MRINFEIGNFDQVDLENSLSFVKKVKSETIELEDIFTSIQLSPDDIARFRDFLSDIGDDFGYIASRQDHSLPTWKLKLGKYESTGFYKT